MASPDSITLVTGAAGFIGSHVVEELLNRGKPVRAFVRQENSQTADWLARGAEVFVGDVRDAAAVEKAAAGAAVIQHCAAAVAPHYTDQELREINVAGVRNALEALRRNGAGRLVLLSSINVLGNRNLEGSSEDLPYRPFGEVRGDVKIDAEKLALDYHRQHGVDVTILRAAMVYGPGDNNLEKMLGRIRKGKFVFMGSRDNVIPTVYVENLVQALLLAGESPKANGRVYHIADAERVTAGELADYLAEVTSSPKSTSVMPYPVARSLVALFGALKKVGVLKKPPLNRVSLRFLGTSRQIDTRRAREELGYEPQVDFRAGMAEAVRWFEIHANDKAELARSSA